MLSSRRRCSIIKSLLREDKNEAKSERITVDDFNGTTLRRFLECFVAYFLPTARDFSLLLVGVLFE